DGGDAEDMGETVAPVAMIGRVHRHLALEEAEVGHGDLPAVAGRRPPPPADAAAPRLVGREYSRNGPAPRFRERTGAPRRARRQRSAAQARWMRRHASSSAWVEVA